MAHEVDGKPDLPAVGLALPRGRETERSAVGAERQASIIDTLPLPRHHDVRARDVAMDNAGACAARNPSAACIAMSSASRIFSGRSRIFSLTVTPTMYAIARNIRPAVSPHHTAG